MRWRRLRKWAKWTCSLAAGGTVALAVFSRFYVCGYATTSNAGDALWSLGVASGQLFTSHSDGVLKERPPRPLGWDLRRTHYWYWGYSGEASPYGNFLSWHGGLVFKRLSNGWIAGASVLYPVALTLMPVALLWYADRRRRGPGSCGSCGYDRVGLAPDAKCPECGTVPGAGSVRCWGRWTPSRPIPLWVLVAFAFSMPCLTGFLLSFVAQTGPVITQSVDTAADLVFRDGTWRLRTFEPNRQAILSFKGRVTSVSCGDVVVRRTVLFEVTSVAVLDGTDPSLAVSPDIAESLMFQLIARGPHLPPAFQENATLRLRSIKHEYYARRIAGGLVALPLLGSLTIILLGLAPLGLTISARARSQGWLAAGRCGRCGYARRGLAADAKCPECGTVPAPAAK